MGDCTQLCETKPDRCPFPSHLKAASACSLCLMGNAKREAPVWEAQSFTSSLPEHRNARAQTSTWMHVQRHTCTCTHTPISCRQLQLWLCLLGPKEAAGAPRCPLPPPATLVPVPPGSGAGRRWGGGGGEGANLERFINRNIKLK